MNHHLQRTIMVCQIILLSITCCRSLYTMDLIRDRQQALEECVEDLRNGLCSRVEDLEKKVYTLTKEIQRKSKIVLKPGLEGFADHQSFEEVHPCFKKTKIFVNSCIPSENPNNYMCFTPTTMEMFMGSDSIPLISIFPLRTASTPQFFENAGKVEARFRVDILIEFFSVEAAGYFTGSMKNGSSRVSETEYESFVHVLNPKEFVEFLTNKGKHTQSRWASVM